MGDIKFPITIMQRPVDDSDTPANTEILTYSSALGMWVSSAAPSTGAPTDAFYLVTAANASLTNEVVVSAYPFVNADIAAAAAIAYSKLNLALSIVNADISTTAAIALSKLAAPTRGDLMVGNSTPAWSGLAIGLVDTYAYSDGIDPSWANSIRLKEITAPAAVADKSFLYCRDINGFATPFARMDTAYYSGYQINMRHLIPSTRSRKFGYLAPSDNNAFTGTGVVINATNVGTVTNTTGTTGRALTFATGATSGNNAGVRQASSVAPQWRGDYNPYFTARFSVNSITNVRMFIGLKQTPATDFAGDDPLNALHGFALGLRDADTIYQIASNDGAGATVFASTGVTEDTGIHVFEMYGDNANTRWGWSLDGSAISWISADIPAMTQAIGFSVEIETGANADKLLTVYDVYGETDF